MQKEQQNPQFFYSLTDLGIAHPVAVQIFAGMRAARHDKERQDIDGVHEILCTGGGRERAVKGGRRPFSLLWFSFLARWAVSFWTEKEGGLLKRIVVPPSP